MKKFKLSDFVTAIANEHFEMTKRIDKSDNVISNINYLWHTYNRGANSGIFRPFIFLAEMKLLKELGYIDENEIQNMCTMMKSEDKDNFHILCLVLYELRNQRIKTHGLYTGEVNKSYVNLINNYCTLVINRESFSKFN